MGDKSNLKKNTFMGLLWGGLNNGVQQFIGFALGLILLNRLSPGDYGLVGMLSIFIYLAQTLATGGFQSALVNRKEFRHEDYNAVLWFNIFVSVGLYVILWFLSPLIADFFGHPELIRIGRWLFLSFVFNSISISHNAYMFKYLMVRERAVYEIIAAALSAVLAIYLAIRGYGYWALVVHTVSQTAISAALKWVFVPWKPTWRFSFQPIKEMFGFSFTLVISSMVGQIQNNIFSLILGRKLSKEAVGYYSQGMKWSNMAQSLFSGMFFNVAQPTLSQTMGDQNRNKRAFMKILSTSALVVAPSLLGIAFIGREFIELVNIEFAPSIPILQIYCLFFIASIFQMLFNQLFASYDKPNIILTVSLISAAMQIVSAFCTYTYGITVMAWSATIINFIVLGICIVLSRRTVHFSLAELFKSTLPAFVATALAMLVAGLAVQSIESIFLVLCLKIIITASIYIAILFFIHRESFHEVMNILGKS